VHIGLVRARFGSGATSGVPTAFHWETLASRGEPCNAPASMDDDAWAPVTDADQGPDQAWPGGPQPPRRSWFVDAEACALRLVIDATNGGAPVVHSVEAFESARDVLRDARASDEGQPGSDAGGAIDGTYAGRWVGAPGRGRWALRFDLAAPLTIDRVRLVLGYDAASVPRPGGGRSYAVASAPARYRLETSDDGETFTGIAEEPHRPDGTVLPLRRRLVTMAPRTVRALRLVMERATGESGVPDASAAPVVREVAAYRADDARPILAQPWILSVNANPSGQTRLAPGGEWANDAYHATFLHTRLAPLLPVLRRDDRFAGMPTPYGDLSSGASGEAFESIEGDDPVLGADLLSRSSPPPIVVLGGSNEWDYATETAADVSHPDRWHWDPLRDAHAGGMGNLGPAIARRVAPFLGICGGAQILALLEAGRLTGMVPDEDGHVIDLVLKRTSGHPIRGFAPPADLARAWPGEARDPRAKVSFAPDDPIFEDLAGPARRSTTRAMPESHSDAVRADAFLLGGPLQRLEVLATSAFCGPDVVAAGPRDGIFPNPEGSGWCNTVPEAFRSRDVAWPVIGTQFHPEQRDFFTPAAGDPPESVADPRLFLAGAYEVFVDAYEKLGP
jgi:hypothetical protein